MSNFDQTLLPRRGYVHRNKRADMALVVTNPS
jgi:hypothetical protein